MVNEVAVEHEAAKPQCKILTVACIVLMRSLLRTPYNTSCNDRIQYLLNDKLQKVPKNRTIKKRVPRILLSG